MASLGAHLQFGPACICVSGNGGNMAAICVSNKTPPAKPPLPSVEELGQPDARQQPRQRKRSQPRPAGRPAPSIPSDYAGDDLGCLAVRGVGEVYINDRETLKLAEAYMAILRRTITAKEKGA